MPTPHEHARAGCAIDERPRPGYAIDERPRPGRAIHERSGPGFTIHRRRLLGAGIAWPFAHAARAQSADARAGDAEAALRAGGVVVAFRHAHAPGTFDPPGFRLGDCATQRNLGDDGRAQARRIGEWFGARSLRPDRVRSSPWCRCIDTATLAFGVPEIFAALGSPHGAAESTSAASLAELRAALAARSARRAGFEVWVTHMFVLANLTGMNTASGEGLVMRADADGVLRVVARLSTI